MTGRGNSGQNSAKLIKRRLTGQPDIDLT